MTEKQWLTSDSIEALLHGLTTMQYDETRVPTYVATFAENGRLRRLLSPEMQPAFDDYVRWVQNTGPNPQSLYPRFSEFDPLDRGLIDASSVEHDLKHLIGFPLDSSSWWAAGSFALAEAYDRPVVRQWWREPNAETAERLRCSIYRLRDVVGNPFRPVTFSPGWRTDTSVSLARQMYESRDFSAMPILADALQDAGCDIDDVLTHCRGAGPHVRGCWVVDLVLGKE